MAAFWQISPDLAANPPVVEVTAAGVWPLALDLTPYLVEGETPRSPKATLTDIATGLRVPVQVAPLDGATMTVVVKGLEVNRDYKLVYNWTISAVKQPSRIQIVRCIA